MILSIINADRKKLKRAPLWLAFIFMPIIPALLGTLNYSANLEILENGWYSLWTQNTLFTCYFFLPIMLGIYCSYLISIERANHNWNKVLSMPVPVWQIFLSKLIISSFMLIISEIWIGVLSVSYTHLRAHETGRNLVCRLLLEKKKKKIIDVSYTHLTAT